VKIQISFVKFRDIIIRASDLIFFVQSMSVIYFITSSW